MINKIYVKIPKGYVTLRRIGLNDNNNQKWYCYNENEK